MKRLLLYFVGLLFTSLAHADNTIKLGFNTWMGYQAVAIAEQKHFFADQGVQVQV